jgi:hypothetical protein
MSRTVRSRVLAALLVALAACLGLAVQATGAAAKVHKRQVDPSDPDDQPGKPRVLVLTDIGNEPDDQMSLTRFLV